jgi:hypothetical protein
LSTELTDEFKLQTLWREHEAKTTGGKIFGRDIKDVVIWALLAATAGTNDNVQTLLENVLK